MTDTPQTREQAVAAVISAVQAWQQASVPSLEEFIEATLAPFLVIDRATARDEIAKAYWNHGDGDLPTWDELDEIAPDTKAACYAVADSIIAALQQRGGGDDDAPLTPDDYARAEKAFEDRFYGGEE